MNKITSFTFVTLNGFYKGDNEDTSWHQHGGEAAEFASKASGGGNILLFGRKTFEMMESFWPTPMAAELFPVVAENMNKAEKIVCSKTLQTTQWENTSIYGEDCIARLTALKKNGNKSITVLGSGNLLTQLSEAGLIDEYMLMIDPVALGNGVPVFDGLKNKLELKLVSSRIFKNDSILLLTYHPK